VNGRPPCDQQPAEYHKVHLLPFASASVLPERLRLLPQQEQRRNSEASIDAATLLRRRRRLRCSPGRSTRWRHGHFIVYTREQVAMTGGTSRSFTENNQDEPDYAKRVVLFYVYLRTDLTSPCSSTPTDHRIYWSRPVAFRRRLGISTTEVRPRA